MHLASRGVRFGAPLVGPLWGRCGAVVGPLGEPLGGRLWALLVAPGEPTELSAADVRNRTDRWQREAK